MFYDHNHTLDHCYGQSYGQYGHCEVSSAQRRHHRRQADRQQPGGGLGPGAGVAEVTLAEAHVHLQQALH